jgi:hypothetical protein
LAFTFAKNKKENSAASRGEISNELVSIVERARGGGLFTITASVQDEGRFVYVSRTFFVKGGTH